MDYLILEEMMKKERKKKKAQMKEENSEEKETDNMRTIEDEAWEKDKETCREHENNGRGGGENGQN